VIVDAHFHCWRLARGDYGWLTPALAPIHRDITIDDWLRVARPFGVQGGVLVQAAPTEAETAFLLEQAAAEPAVVGVVGWVDLLAPDAPARITRLAAHPKLKALRPMLHDLPDPQWMLQPALEPALRAMVENGLAFDALVRPAHLAPLLTFCRRHPDLRVVVDHCAKPDIAARQWQPWADEMAQLANESAAVCKLSGLLTEAGPAPPTRAVQPWALHVLAHFGPERTLWGSDWPVLELVAPYAAWWSETEALLARLDIPARTAVLGGTAQRIYRL